MSGTFPAATGPLTGSVTVPTDKGIAHRAALLGAIAQGRTIIDRFSPAGDCASTLAVVRGLGVPVHVAGSTVTIDGGDLADPSSPLPCGRSGSTIRMAAGLLAGAQVRCVLDADDQLRRRPMGRVVAPLTEMGSRITAVDGRPPLTLDGGALTGITYTLPVASAQVKSAVLLAGLGASGATRVVEPVPTRDHSERMLRAMGAHIDRGDGWVEISPGSLTPLEMAIPGDISSAAAFVVAAAIVPGSLLTVPGVGVNPTRTGLEQVLARMGAHIHVDNLVDDVEPIGDLVVGQRPLTASRVVAAEIPGLVDEVMLLALAATQAEGRTVIESVGELRVKESDRLAGIVDGLTALGAQLHVDGDDLIIDGPTPLTGGTVDALDDHRLAMAFAVASLIASGDVQVVDGTSTGDSFPGFEQTWTDLVTGR